MESKRHNPTNQSNDLTQNEIHHIHEQIMRVFSAAYAAYRAIFTFKLNHPSSKFKAGHAQ